MLRARSALPYFFNELVFRERGFKGFYLISLFSENVTTSLVDIFQEQNFDILGSKWLQVLRIG